MFAEIAVDTYQDPTKKLFTYSVPKEMEGKMGLGAEVLIPFGKRSVKGYVVNLTKKRPPFPTKPVKEIRKVEFTPAQIKLARWMSRRYAALPIDCLKCQRTGRGERYAKGTKTQIKTLLLVPYAAQVKLKSLKLPAAKKKTTLIGSRSAVFTTLPNLKRIIIEEPEDWAYKDERAPYYHAKDIAQKRAEIEGLELELRYLVPRVEDITLQKSHKRSLAGEATIVDLRKEYTTSRLGSEAIKALRKARKALLYTNSREAKEGVAQTIKEHALDVNRTEITGPQVFSRIGKTFDYAVMVDTDTIFNLPDFRAHEKLLLIITRIKRMTKGPVFIQTNNAHHPFFANLREGSPKTFYERELGERKSLLYPPFGVLAKLEFSAKTTAKVESEAEKLYQKLLTIAAAEELGVAAEGRSHKPLTVDISPPYPPYSKTRGKAQLNISVKAKTREGLEKVLAQVPRTWKIIVDPESLL